MTESKPASKKKATKKKRRPAIRFAMEKRNTSFKKLRALRCFEEVHRRVLDGWSMPAIAAFIQEEADEYTDATREGLITVLRKYRDTIPPAQLVEKRIPPVFEKAVAEVKEGLDELVELEKLYHLQMDRIAIDMAVEKKIGKLLPSMTQEMRTAREILSSVADLKMDLGLNTRHVGKAEVDAKLTAYVENQANPSILAVLSNPEQRQRLLGIAKNLMTSAGKRVLEAQAEEAEPALLSSPEEPEGDEPT